MTTIDRDRDRDRLRRLADAATPGPWVMDDDSRGLVGPWIDGVSEEGTAREIADCTWTDEADAEFITAARNSLPALLDQLEQAEEWADENAHPLIMSQGEILTGVALALNGPTPPLTSWSHHDLAEKARAMTARAEQAEARIQAVREMHARRGVSGVTCEECGVVAPCPTIRALDGAGDNRA